MLQDWLGDISLDTFRASYVGSKPLARPYLARAAIEACPWSELDRMLQAHDAPDMLVVSRGRLVEEPQPRSLAELKRLFERGVGGVIRDPEQKSPSVRRLALQIGADWPGQRRVLVFATPKGTHGFGWHYDAEEVLIAQTAGTKEYFFRQNTLDPEPRYGAQPDFSKVRFETTPLMSCTLTPGDWLYLPRGYWHLAQPISDSLSISIGILPSCRTASTQP